MKALINLLMVLVKASQLTLLCQGVVQRQVSKVGLGFCVTLEEVFHHLRHRAELGRGRKTGKDTLNLVEDREKDNVLRDECVGDFHQEAYFSR